MSIRLKLILSYLGLILLSLLVLFGGFIIATGRMMSDFAENAFNGKDFEEVSVSVVDTLVDLEYMRRYEPELYSDPDHMLTVEEKIAGLDMSMYVERQGEMVYESRLRPDIKLSDFLDELDFDNGHEQATKHDRTFDITDYEIDGQFYMIFRIDDVDGDETVYVIYEAASRSRMHWNLYGGIYRVGLVVIVFILGALVLIINANIIKPIRKLEQATNDIRDGNLDFSIKTKQKDEFGQVMNAFDTMREELKNSIEQQIEYEDNRKELIASISHDLKTPITSIKGYVEGIRDGVANDQEKMNQYLEVIHQKSVDLDKLIDDLFLFSKLDLNRIPFDFTRVNAKSFFRDCGDELSMDVAKFGFSFKINNQLSEDTAIKVDLQQFRRVITNIVSNAVKYSEDIKEIEFDITEDNEKVQLAIKDHGKGIDPASLEKIFDKFYRVDPSRNQEVMGSGLGLAIAKQIMDNHDGTITAESVVGKGTTIYLRLNKVETTS